MDFDTILKFLDRGGLVAFLMVFVVLGGYLGWYVFGPAHGAEVKALTTALALSQKNAADWQEIATKSVENAKQQLANNELMMAMVSVLAKRNGAQGQGNG